MKLKNVFIYTILWLFVSSIAIAGFVDNLTVTGSLKNGSTTGMAYQSTGTYSTIANPAYTGHLLNYMGGTPVWTTTATLGEAGTASGILGLAGSTSGLIAVKVQAAAGTYNFNLPTSAGTSGQPLLSGGGSSSPMTFGTLGIGAGGTGQTTANAALNALLPSQATHSGKLLTTNGTDTSWTTAPSGFTYFASYGSVYGGTDVALTASATNDTIVGPNAGTALSSGTGNSFYGAYSGQYVSTANNNTAIGFSAGPLSNVASTTSIGSGAVTGAAGATAVGYSATGTGASSVAIGYQATPGDAYAIAIGRGAKTTSAGNIHIGGSDLTTVDSATGQFIVGSPLYPITDMYFNSAVGTATPSAVTFQPGKGAGTDIAGSNLTIRPGNGTGAGGSGTFKIQTAPTAASGTTANTYVDQISISPSGWFTLGPQYQGTSSLLQVDASGVLQKGTATVAQGGTGATTLTQYGVLVGNGTGAIQALAASGAGKMLEGVAGANPAFTYTPTLGLAAGGTGKLNLAGTTSGTITIQPQDAAGTYNFNLPTTAGTSGYLLTSAGGAGSPMTWTNPASLGVTTDFTGDAGAGGVHGLVPAPSAGDGAAGKVLKADGTWGTAGTASPLTTKGDIYTYSTVNARLAVGTDGYILKADSAASTGLSWLQTLPVANGGTGANTLTQYGVLLGNGTGAVAATTAGTTGQVLIATSAANPSFSSAPVLGLAGGSTGTLGFSGTTSGTVTVQPQAAAGTYNFNLPTTAGTSGQLLTSAGGGASAMTWTDAGANTTLSNLGTVSFNSDLVPSANNTRAVGSYTKHLSMVYSKGYVGYSVGSQSIFTALVDDADTNKEMRMQYNSGSSSTMPGGLGSVNATITASGSASTGLPLGIYTTNFGPASTAVGGSLLLATGNRSNGTTSAAGSGDIKLSTGLISSGSGTRGSVYVQPELRLEGTTSGYAGIAASATTTSYTMTLPNAQGASGSFMTNNGSGTMSWTSTLPVANGGTGATTLTQYGVLLGNGTGAIAATSAGSSGQVLQSTTGGNPSFTNTVVLGDTGSTTGNITLKGSTSGAITIQPQAAAGTYNFLLPTTAGSAGQVLTSGGGGVTEMTWTSPLTNPMDGEGQLIYGGVAGAATKLAAGTSGYILKSNGAAAPSWLQTLPVANGGTGTTTAMTQGSVLFAGASGVYSQDNTNFFWDDTNNRLGIRTASPAYPLDVNSADAAYGITHTANGVTIGTYINSANTSYSAQFGTKSNHSWAFFTNDGTPFMRLTTDSKVAVSAGTTTIATKMQVGQTNTANASPAQLYLAEYNSSGSVIPTLILNWNSSNTWGIGPADTGSGKDVRIGNIDTPVSTSSTWAGTQDITVRAANYVADTTLVANGSQISTARISATFDQASNKGGAMKNSSATATGTYWEFQNSSGTVQGSITQTNSTTTAYNTTSDYRLKENVIRLPDALERVLRLKPSRYNFIQDKEEGEGFLAHELAEVVPFAVTGAKDAMDENGAPVYQQVDYSKVVPLLTAAIQELSAKNDALEKRIKALERKAQ